MNHGALNQARGDSIVTTWNQWDFIEQSPCFFWTE
jgi:hypothetical protein